MDKFIADAEKWASEDKKLKEIVDAKNDLENYLYNVRNSINTEEFKQMIDSDNLSIIISVLKNGFKWLENPYVSDSDSNSYFDSDSNKVNMVTAMQYKEKKNEICGVLGPIMSSVYDTQHKCLS